MLAAASVEELRDPPTSCCFYFFFSEMHGAERREDAYRAILAQTLQHQRDNPGLIAALDFAMSNSPQGQKIASTQETIDLLRLCISSISGTSYVVLDGIDECNESEQLVSDLEEIFGGSTVRLLLFSRPNVLALANALSTEQRFSVGKRTESDICQYATSQIRLIKHRRLLPPDSDISELVERLVSGSDGMFLWAKLMIDFLKLPIWQPKKRIKLILDVTRPERIDDVYTRIIGHIHRLESAERQLAKWVITWLTHSRRELSADELRESSRLVGTETEEEANEDDHFEQSVIVSCACLVKKDTTQRPPVFRFVHFSAKEFLMHAGKDVETSISFSSPTSHAIIARGSLQYLLTCIPAVQLSAGICRDTAEASLAAKYPLCNYSALNWIFHFERCILGAVEVKERTKTDQTRKKYQELMENISRFVNAPEQIAAWIELHHVFKATIAIEGLVHVAQRARNAPEFFEFKEDVFDRLLGLAEYLHNLGENWGPQLIETPSCIWMECAAFDPNQFIPENSMMHVHRLPTSDSESSALSTVPLKTISATSPDGTHVGVLSIWPSRSYIFSIAP